VLGGDGIRPALWYCMNRVSQQKQLPPRGLQHHCLIKHRKDGGQVAVREYACWVDGVRSALWKSAAA
jgi:hypothetical protein